MLWLTMPGERFRSTPRLGSMFLVLVAGVAVFFPLLMVLGQVIGGAWNQGLAARDVSPEPMLLLRTVAVVLIIAAGATMLAWPAAWAARAWPARLLILLMVPMLLPSYLAYSGWGIARSPGMWLGDFLIRGPAGAAPGENWWPLAAARVQAVLGLTLWSWPLAMAIIVARLRRIDPATLESLRLEPIGRARRLFTILNMTRGGTLAAMGAVALVMLGSAVPLHVAQLETYSMVIWLRLTSLPHAEHWRIWPAAWPLLAIAAGASAIVTRRVMRMDVGAGSARTKAARRLSAPSLLFTCALWALSVLVPVALFISTLRSTRPLMRFWEFSWQQLAGSATVGGAIAALALAITVSVWAAWGMQWPRRVAIIVTGVLLGAGLTPGILVGAATAQAWTALGVWIPAAQSVADSPAILVIAHTARFGFIPALAGVFLAMTEPRTQRDLRALDAGTGFSGFARAALVPQVGTLLAVALATGLLSFHEIEAAVLIQPPSAIGGGLPWQMLQWLHFARMEDLSAAVIWVVAIALAVLALAGAAIWLGGRRAGRARP